MTEQNTTSNDVPKRKIGCLLLLGIVFLPFIFVWFLLKPGYSKASKIVGFIWLLVVFVFIFIPNKAEVENVAKEKPVTEEPRTTSESAADETALTMQEAETEVSPEEMMPQKETNFIELLKKAWEKSEYSYTEAEKYKLISERKKAVTNGYQMTDWIGKVEYVVYRQEANEIQIAINIYQGRESYHSIALGTGASADIRNRIPHTVKEGSAMFEKVIALEPDDVVKFSGILYLKYFDPMFASMSDKNPLVEFSQQHFLTKFSKIEKIE